MTPVSRLPRPSEVFLSDSLSDVTALVLSMITIAWSVYIVAMDTYRPFLRPQPLVLVLNGWFLVREILDNRFRYQGWLFLVHSLLIVPAIVWTFRCTSPSPSHVQWCKQFYRPIFGLLLCSTAIYVLSILLFRPPSSTFIKWLKVLYNE